MAKNKMHTSHSSSQYNDEWGCLKWCQYALFLVLTTLLLLAASVLMIFWTLNYQGPISFDWDTKPDQAVNLHAIMMVTGFITLCGFSTLTFRICRCFKRVWVKLFHTIIHSLAIVCISVGFICMFEFYNAKGLHHFYSIHSWLGVVTIGLFSLQFFLGFFSFLLLACCQNSTASFRAKMVPIHSAMGLTTFFLAVATCLTGMVEEFVKLPSPGSNAENVLNERILGFGGTTTTAAPQHGLPVNIGVYLTAHFVLNILTVILVSLVILIAIAVRGQPRPDSDELPCAAWSPTDRRNVKPSGSRATIGTY